MSTPISFSYNQKPDPTADWNSAKHYYAVNGNEREFEDYARLSKRMKQLLGYKGIIEDQVDQSDSTTGYASTDTTLGTIEPVVVFPSADYVKGQDSDTPGKTGGPSLNPSNAASVGANPYFIALPMLADTTIPTHTVDSPITNIIDLANIGPDDNEQTITISVEIQGIQSNYLDGNNDTVYVIPVLAANQITFQFYNDESQWETVTASAVWTGGLKYTFTRTLPETDTTQQLSYKVTFADGVDETTYKYIIKGTVNSVLRFETEQSFTVEAAE